MAQSTVKNLMIEMKSFDNDSTRVRLDNPKEGITRAQIATAMQPAFTNGWIITDKGSTAGYLGETVLETSTKISLEGEDFYVTPNSLNITNGNEYTLTVTGAKIQGYNIKNRTAGVYYDTFMITVSQNGLTATVQVRESDPVAGTCDLILIILGQEVTIPVTVNIE